MGIFRLIDFAEKFEGQLFYAGFLRGRSGWFPLARAEGEERLDTLLVTLDRKRMEGLVARAMELLEKVDATDIDELYAGEVFNRAQRYGLDFIQIVD